MIAANAMNFAPMLSVLFIGARMRALQMDPVNGAPQKWAQNCFYMCTYATAAQVLISIAVTLVLSGTSEPNPKVEGDMTFKVENKALGACLSVARYLIMFCIYIGFTCVIYSVFTIQHPKGKQYTPPISVTMQCVVNLTTQFFTVYTLIWVCITVKEITGWELHFLSNAMENAKGTIAFCPMLAILFVGTRMRALQLTNNRGAPQGWCQDGMYMATWSILLQFMMVLLIPVCTLVMEGKAVQPDLDEDGNVKWRPDGAIAVMIGAYTMTPETANGRGAVPLVGQTPFAS